MFTILFHWLANFTKPATFLAKFSSILGEHPPLNFGLAHLEYNVRLDVPACRFTIWEDEKLPVPMRVVNG